MNLIAGKIYSKVRYDYDRKNVQNKNKSDLDWITALNLLSEYKAINKGFDFKVEFEEREESVDSSNNVISFILFVTSREFSRYVSIYYKNNIWHNLLS